MFAFVYIIPQCWMDGCTDGNGTIKSRSADTRHIKIKWPLWNMESTLKWDLRYDWWQTEARLSRSRIQHSCDQTSRGQLMAKQFVTHAFNGPNSNLLARAGHALNCECYERHEGAYILVIWRTVWWTGFGTGYPRLLEAGYPDSILVNK